MGDHETGEIKILSAAARRGVDWLIDGFRIFRKNWLTWIGVQISLILILLFLTFFLSIVFPFMGFVIQQVILPVFLGGMLLGCRDADHGGDFTFGHLFAGFSDKLIPLVIIGAVHLLGSLLIMTVCLIIFVVLTGSLDTIMETLQALNTALLEQDINRIAEISGQFGINVLLVELIGLALYLPLLVLLWFAPVLIMLKDVNPLTAMIYSFTGCIKNIIPYLVYGVVGLVLSFIATIPFFLGWLVLTPMIIASVYLSYKDIFDPDIM